MVKTYTGKSPRNARIKIDYTGESPSVKFQYPRKNGFHGSMLSYLLIVWFFLLLIIYYSSSIAIAIISNNQKVSPNEIETNNTQINNSINDNNTLTNNNTQNSLELEQITKEKKLEQLNKKIEEKEKEVRKIPLKVLLAFLILFLPRSEERRVGKECRSRWSP